MSEAANAMNDTKLKELINLKIESEDLDYKTTIHPNSVKSVLDICVDVMAMANTLGGYVVFGVNDSFEPIGLPETFHIDPAQIQHRSSTDPAQIQHRSSTDPAKPFKLYEASSQNPLCREEL